MVKSITTALVFATIFIWMACSIDELPFEPMGDPAAKTTVAEAPCFIIQWDCNPSMWMTEADSVYSIFYQNYRFQTRGSAVILTEYIDDSSKREYEAHPTLSVFERKRARFQWTDDGKCGLWSDAIRDTTVAVRIFEGDVQWRYRTLPSHTQYAVKEDDVPYKIATVNEDTTLRYVDFYSFHDRLNAPPSLDGKRYYLPITFSQSALDTLLHIPDNDSLYIESPFRCEDDESCAEWPEAMCPEPEPVEVAAGTGVESVSSVAGSSSPRVPHKGYCNFGSDDLGYPCDPDGIEYPRCVSPTLSVPPRVDCGNYERVGEDEGFIFVSLSDGQRARSIACTFGSWFRDGACCPRSRRFNTETQVCEPTGETVSEIRCSFGSNGIGYRCDFGGFDPGYPSCTSPIIRVPPGANCGYFERREDSSPGYVRSVSLSNGQSVYIWCIPGHYAGNTGVCCPTLDQQYYEDTQRCEPIRSE